MQVTPLPVVGFLVASLSLSPMWSFYPSSSLSWQPTFIFNNVKILPLDA